VQQEAGERHQKNLLSPVAAITGRRSRTVAADSIRRALSSDNHLPNPENPVTTRTLEEPQPRLRHGDIQQESPAETHQPLPFDIDVAIRPNPLPDQGNQPILFSCPSRISPVGCCEKQLLSKK
jgi:hypothetical protein